ncbi:MAG: flagellar basal body P-ring protein FlgI [Planctomycetia bacterium]|nr:flagellar basal body P-ring protein FlgI [Planctomycetia bacterium]
MRSLVFSALCLALLAGCSTLDNMRSQSPEEPDATAGVQLVGNVAIPYGRDEIEVEGVGLVVGLPGTGSDPPPSIYRSMLLDEMHKYNVPRAEELLASKDTALVLVSGKLRMGMQSGDKFDVELTIPARGETKSLRSGWLMEVRLTEKAVLGGEVRSGRLLAKAQGPVLVDGVGSEEGDDPAANVRGRVLGGGVSLSDHAAGLILATSYQQVVYSALVGNAVNQRFHTYRNGVRQNLANPKNNEYVDLRIHPRYKHNVPRYLRVVRALPLRETTTQRVARLEVLQRQLLDPLTSSTAALRLEAVGHEGVPALLKGLESPDPEARFHAAEALAYLDHDQSIAAAPILGSIARNESAFRVFALTALSAMNSFESREQLRELLNVKSAETRYGAFRALWAMDNGDPLVKGEMLGGKFSYHTIGAEGPPMIHVTNSFRPEIVLFGNNQQLLTPLTLEAGKSILITAPAGGPLTVSRFAVGEPDQKRQVSPKLDDVIRAAVELEGTYPDVVQMLQQASQKNLLADGSRLVADAIPQADRVYRRPGSPEATAEAPTVSLGPLPNLFPSLARRSTETEDESHATGTDVEAPPKSFWQRFVNFIRPFN